MGYPAKTVANAILELAEKSRKSLTQLSLQKLSYVAHGHFLANYGEPLLVGQAGVINRGPAFVALQYGPVSPALLSVFGQYGSSPIPADESQNWLNKLNPKDADLLALVFGKYSQYTAGGLVDLTHRTGTPWAQVFNHGAGKWNEIPDQLTREHYKALLDKEV